MRLSQVKEHQEFSRYEYVAYMFLKCMTCDMKYTVPFDTVNLKVNLKNVKYHKYILP